MRHKSTTKRRQANIISRALNYHSLVSSRNLSSQYQPAGSNGISLISNLLLNISINIRIFIHSSHAESKEIQMQRLLFELHRTLELTKPL